MPTRYQQLRKAVANLAASAEEQVGYLDEFLAPVTNSGSAAAYGNDELALMLEDIFCAAGDMIWHGELSDAEKVAIQPLDDLLQKWSGAQHSDFWRRDALFHDPRWAEVRAYAAQALTLLPDEQRAVGRSE